MQGDQVYGKLNRGWKRNVRKHLIFNAIILMNTSKKSDKHIVLCDSPDILKQLADGTHPFAKLFKNRIKILRMQHFDDFFDANLTKYVTYCDFCESR